MNEQGKLTFLGCVLLLCFVIFGGVCVIATIQGQQQSQLTDQANRQDTQTAVETDKEATATQASADATNTAANATSTVANATSTVVAATQLALTPTPPTVTVDLLTASNQHLVTISFTSNGNASGDAISITLQRSNNPNSDLQVTLPPGLILANSDPSQQNMVLLGQIFDAQGQPVKEMELPPQQNMSTYDAVAYCAQLHNGNPIAGTSMTQSGLGSPDLVSLMKTELSRNGSDSAYVIQDAVWAITDNPTIYDIHQVGYPVDVPSVRDLLLAAGLIPANYQLTA